MCKLIAEITQTNKTVLKEIISRFEARAAQPGIDIRLTSEIFSTAHLKTRALGLDPHDTTGRELHAALKATASLHDSFIMKHFNISQKDSTLDVLDTVLAVQKKLNYPKQAQYIRPVILKQIISKLPPKQTMKLLGYRTVDSLIKRESPGAILGVAKIVESKTWLTKLQAAYNKLQPYDMTTATIVTSLPKSKKWLNISDELLSRHHVPILITPEAGEVTVIPINRSNRAGYSLLMLAMIIHAVKEIRMLSSYLKFQQLNPQFGKLLVDTLFFDETLQINVVGQDIHWRSFQRHYSRSNHSALLSHPHIQAEDFAYRSAEAVLYRLEPALSFWSNLDYVGLSTAHGTVSFNLIDILMDLVNQTDYKHRHVQHVRQSLWDELFARYLNSDHIHSHASRQLEPKHVSGPMLADFEFAL